MNGREDADLGFAKVTQKKMPNGEIRTRMKLPGGIATTITEMPDWDPKDGVPWQEAHFHKGLTENYLVISGWIYLFFVFRGELSFYLHKARYMDPFRVFLPEEQHLVLPGSRCVFQTTTYGSPVGNPDKSGNDWWPGSSVLLEYAKKREESIMHHIFQAPFHQFTTL